MRASVPVIAAILFVSASAADAASTRKRQHGLDGYAQRYPHATSRQLRNLRAYERGEYYETLSDALPAGSRPWFEQKEREELLPVLTVRALARGTRRRKSSALASVQNTRNPTFQNTLFRRRDSA